MFKEERKAPRFEWHMIGDIPAGRPTMGADMNVAVYRLLQYSLRDVMIVHLGVAASERIVREAGELAGREFHRQLITPTEDLKDFLKQVAVLFKDLKIGFVRVENLDEKNNELTITVSEDLDCSGLKVSDEVVCTWDEGFLGGLFSEQTGLKFDAREVDCWCSGAGICRFKLSPVTR